MTQAKAGPIYGNWSMYSPDGVLMCRQSDDRAEWYLSRGLATQTGPSEITLTFMPNGYGSHGIDVLLAEKANRCVVCGTEDNLNRHHVVPYQFRKRFPLEHKARTSYDVLPLCIDHHEEYEVQAWHYTVNVGKQFGIDFTQTFKVTPEIRASIKAQGSAAVLIGPHHSKIPAERIEALEQSVKDHLGVDHLTFDDLTDLACQPRPKFGFSTSRSERLIETVLEAGELQNFVVGWRLHFIETMKPKFMPEGWDPYFVYPRHTP